MTTTLKEGHRDWYMTRDEEGHREYTVVHLVVGDTTDGPLNALQTPGLPQAGDQWSFDGDTDPFAWCRKNAKIRPLVTKEKQKHWEIEQIFSTRPLPPRAQTCSDEVVEDPLREPIRISGGSLKTAKEATIDRWGRSILTSSHEMLRGPQVEFDEAQSTVKISFNVAVLNLRLLAYCVNRVNSVTMWGFLRRCVRLLEYTWEKKYHGQCQVYYTVNLIFETNIATFDRDILDEGTKVLHGHWDTTTGAWTLDQINGADPDPSNPSHFDRFKDRNGENARVVLNGHGLPSDVIVNRPPPPPSPYYIAIAVTTGDPLTDDTKWLVQVGGDIGWDSNDSYVVGNIVAHDEILYIALANISGLEPGVSDLWLALGDGIVDKGEYDVTGLYTVGDRVTDPGVSVGTGDPEQAGYIHVEKYDEVNFLTALNIPATL